MKCISLPCKLHLQLVLDYMFYNINLFYCRQIESTEYVDDLFELKSRYGVPMLSQFAELVNREMFWVVTEVCSEHNLVRRSKIIKQFIKIARKYLESLSLFCSYIFFSYIFYITAMFFYRSMQGVQKFQFHVRDRIRFGPWLGVEIKSFMGKIANQISEIIQRSTRINGS